MLTPQLTSNMLIIERETTDNFPNALYSIIFYTEEVKGHTANEWNFNKSVYVLCILGFVSDLPILLPPADTHVTRPFW